MASLTLNKQKYKNLQIDKKKQQIKNTILCLDNKIDDDLYKIYYIESQDLGNKWYRVIATAFGTTSCSCEYQTKNPYQSCIHMKRIDKIVKETPSDIQRLSHIPRFILDIF